MHTVPARRALSTSDVWLVNTARAVCRATASTTVLARERPLYIACSIQSEPVGIQQHGLQLSPGSRALENWPDIGLVITER